MGLFVGVSVAKSTGAGVGSVGEPVGEGVGRRVGAAHWSPLKSAQHRAYMSFTWWWGVVDIEH